MFWETFRFELRLRFRSWTTYILLLVLAAFTIRDMMGGYWDPLIGTGRVARNSAYSAHFYITTSVFWCSILSVGLMTAPLLRDLRTGFAPVLYATRITDKGYLLGKYLASMIGLIFVVQGTALGFILLSAFGPFVGNPLPGEYGPTPWPALLQVTLLFTIPGALLHGTLHFLLAARTGRTTASFIVAALFTMLWTILDILFDDSSAIPSAIVILDPIGRQSVYAQIDFWSVGQRAFGLLDVSGPLLGNRLLYLLVTAVLCATLFKGFSLRRMLVLGRDRSTSSTPATAGVSTGRAPLRKAPKLDMRARSWLKSAIRNGITEWALLHRNWVFMLLVAFTALGSVATAYGMSGSYDPSDIPLLPTGIATIRLATAGASFSILITMLFFAGEMVGRDRSSKINLIIDAAPIPNWAMIAGKGAGIALLALSLATIPAFSTVMTQLLRGHPELIDPASLARITLIYNFPQLLTIGMMALGVHLLVRERMAAHFIAIFGQIMVLILEEAQWVENSLYLFGFHLLLLPESDFATILGEHDRRMLVLSATWLGGAFLLVWAGLLMQVRGVELRFMQRLRILPRHVQPALLAFGGAALVTMLLAGRIAYRNIVTWNEIELREQKLAEDYDYETHFGRLRDAPVPVATRVSLDVTLDPRVRTAAYRYNATLYNAGHQSIAELLVEMPRAATLKSITLDGQTATVAFSRPALDTTIYKLPKALGPGSSVSIQMDAMIAYRGFANDGFAGPVIDGNGVLSRDLLPRFGYNRTREIKLTGDRKRHGLPPRVRIDDRYDRVEAAPWATIGDVGVRISAPVGFTTLSSSDEHAATDRLLAVAGRYVTTKRTVPGVGQNGRPVQISAHALLAHSGNSEAVLDAAEATLKSLAARFGPYPFPDLHIAEGAAETGQASTAAGNLVVLTEKDAWVYDTGNASKVDHLLYTVGYHLASGWFRPVLQARSAPGYQLIDEGVARWIALSLLADVHGPAMAKAKAGLLTDDYFKLAAMEEASEPSIVDSDDEAYIMNKSALALYRIANVAGRDAVDRAFRQLMANRLSRRTLPGIALPEVRALLTEMAPEARPIIDDVLFSKTSFENAIIAASTQKVASGWHSRIRVAVIPMESGKVTSSREIQVPIVISGLQGQTKALSKQLAPGEHELEIITAWQPIEAIFDPDLTLLDRNRADNRRRFSH